MIPPAPASLDFIALRSWLDNKLVVPSANSVKLQKEIEFMLMSLRAELLHDLCRALVGDEATVQEAKQTQTNDKLKLILLSAAGILVAACEGFDSVVTILSIFSLSATVILASACIFSFLCMIAFCGLDLVKLAQGLGVKLGDAHKLLDIYLRQLDEIKLIRKTIANYDLSEYSAEDLKKLALIISLLQQRFAQLDEAGEQFEQILNSTQTQLTKLVLSGVTAALFFGGAFCSGQTVSLFILGFLMTTVTPASLPVLLFSFGVGLAAFSLYWYVELPGLTSLVSGWFGLDEEKIATLCDHELLAKEATKLALLKKRLEGASHLKEQLSELQQVAQTTGQQVVGVASEVIPRSKVMNVGENIFSFMRAKPPIPSFTEERSSVEYSSGLGCM